MLFNPLGSPVSTSLVQDECAGISLGVGFKGDLSVHNLEKVFGLRFFKYFEPGLSSQLYEELVGFPRDSKHGVWRELVLTDKAIEQNGNPPRLPCVQTVDMVDM